MRCGAHGVPKRCRNVMHGVPHGKRIAAGYLRKGYLLMQLMDGGGFNIIDQSTLADLFGSDTPTISTGW